MAIKPKSKSKPSQRQPRPAVAKSGAKQASKGRQRNSPAAGAPPARASGFWNNATIIRRQNAQVANGQPWLVSDFDEERVQPASYRLSVGDEIYISSPAKDGQYPVREILGKRQSKAIPPGQFAFLITEETVHVPPDAIGFITLRLKPTKFKGLVNVSGFHVDPSFSGKLIFSVFNAGPSPVLVTRGDQWFELFFADLKEPYAGDPKTGEGKKGWGHIPSELLMPGPLITMEMLRDDIRESEDRLDDRLQRVERENAILRWAVTLIVGALIAFGVKTCSPVADQASEAKEMRS